MDQTVLSEKGGWMTCSDKDPMIWSQRPFVLGLFSLLKVITGLILCILCRVHGYRIIKEWLGIGLSLGAITSREKLSKNATPGYALVAERESILGRGLNQILAGLTV